VFVALVGMSWVGSACVLRGSVEAIKRVNTTYTAVFFIDVTGI